MAGFKISTAEKVGPYRMASKMWISCTGVLPHRLPAHENSKIEGRGSKDIRRSVKVGKMEKKWARK